jgi:isopenicillin N synthase-like dioxygenase
MCSLWRSTSSGAVVTKELVSLGLANAWRGWFPLGGELTRARPQEGYYFGRELPTDSRPMHGPNIWPTEPAALQPLVTEWMATMEPLAQRVMSLMAQGLGVSGDFFRNGLTADPTPLFRIFRYPPHPPDGADRWGVAEHSDYGLLTLLAHDGTAGLQVKVGDEWIDAPNDPHLIICNLGDMLDRLTAGRYRSTPHRARNSATVDHYSLPFFLDRLGRSDRPADLGLSTTAGSHRSTPTGAGTEPTCAISTAPTAIG